MTETAPPSFDLDALRAEIDTIDADMHRLLIRRGAIIDRLVATKARREGGAFRPDREADMMRRLVERHEGCLPLTTLEHLWREIISTFTQLQAGYAVHLDAGDDPIAMTDMARFYFGFATPLCAAAGPQEALAGLKASPFDLALVRLDGASAPWWRALGADAQVMARLPFLRIDGREAATPALVVSRALEAVRPFDMLVYVLDGAGEDAAPALAAAEAEILAEAGASRLLAVPAERAERLRAELAEMGLEASAAGGYFAPLRVADEKARA